MANDIVARALAIKATEGLTTKADLVDGKIPLGQLPDSLDDVREVASYNDLPKKGKIGVIYVTLDSNQIYRWSGSQYILISSQDIPTKVSELENDAGYLSEIPSEYITENELAAKNYTSKTYVDELVAECEKEPGPQGTTPSIDATSKHWMIGDIDTGIVAEGQAGKDGLTTSVEVNGTEYTQVNGKITLADSFVTYITTAPTADNTNGLKIVVLSTEPTTKYNGYIYIITE